MIGRYFKPMTDDPDVGLIIVKRLDRMGKVESQVIESEEFADTIQTYDLHNFLDDFGDFLKDYSEKTGELKSFSFSPASVYAFPAEDETNSLRYSILRRTFATTEQGADQHTGRKSYNWQLSSIMNDRLNPGYKAMIYTRPYDNTIELASWSKNYRDADRFAYILEDLLDTYSFVFEQKGIIEMRYEGRGRDEAIEANNHQWYSCPIQLYVKTLKVKVVYEKVLESIAINLLKGKN